MSRKITTNIFITEARVVHGDVYDYSKLEYKKANTKVIIICKIHGEFEQTPSGHIRGRGCKKCAIAKATSNNDSFIKKAKKIHGNKYDYSKVEYKKNNIKVQIICTKHGVFLQTPSKHLMGGCKKCGDELSANKQRFSKDKFIAKAKAVHGNKFDYTKVEYKTARIKVDIICNTCGSTFQQVPDSHLKGRTCSYCTGKLVNHTNNLAAKAPEIAKEWDYSKNKGKPEDYYHGKLTKFWWQCSRGHNWKAAIGARTGTRKTGCPFCAGQQVAADNNLEFMRPEIAKDWHPTKNKPVKASDVMPGTDKKYWWLCPKGHDYQASPDKRTGTDNTGCPHCTHQTSTQEMRIMAELDYLGIKILSRYKLNNVEFDVFLPDFNIGIEYDGSFWHKNRVEKDLEKNQFALQHNVHLIRIREKGLSKISTDDITTSSIKHISKHEINELMDAIKAHASELTSKINKYQKLRAFANQELFNKYLSYAPSPLPEKSLEVLSPRVSAEWDYEKNFPLTPKNFTAGSSQKVWWKCTKGHEWKTAISKRAGKEQTNCPHCFKQNMSMPPYEKSFAFKFPEASKEWAYDKNKPLKPENCYAGTARKVWWRCEAYGHEWKTSPMNRRKHGCPTCYNLLRRGRNSKA